MREPLTPKRMQALFVDTDDRALPGSIVGRVLARVGVLPDTAGRVLPWAVLDANEKLEGLVDQDREELAQTKIELGKA